MRSMNLHLATGAQQAQDSQGDCGGCINRYRLRWSQVAFGEQPHDGRIPAHRYFSALIDDRGVLYQRLDRLCQRCARQHREADDIENAGEKADCRVEPEMRIGAPVRGERGEPPEVLAGNATVDIVNQEGVDVRFPINLRLRRTV
jgi:hypothetical protein